MHNAKFSVKTFFLEADLFQIPDVYHSQFISRSFAALPAAVSSQAASLWDSVKNSLKNSARFLPALPSPPSFAPKSSPLSPAVAEDERLLLERELETLRNEVSALRRQPQTVSRDTNSASPDTLLRAALANVENRITLLESRLAVQPLVGGEMKTPAPSASMESRLATLEQKLSSLSLSGYEQRSAGGSFVPAISAPFAAYAFSQKISNLANVTFSGTNAFNLADSDIPDGITVSNYLPMAGGALSGSVTLSGGSGFLNTAAIGTSTPAAAIFAVYGSTTLQTWQNVPTAFRILNSATSSIFTANTVLNRIEFDYATSTGMLTTTFASTTALSATAGTITNASSTYLSTLQNLTVGNDLFVTGDASSTYFSTTQNLNIGNDLFITGDASSTYFSTSQNLNIGNDLLITGDASSTYFSTSQNLIAGNSLITGASSTFGGVINVSSGTSTFNGGVIADLLNIRNTSASSTFANGITLSNGCFAVNGTCIGASNPGWTDDGATIRLTTATDFVGIGTSTPLTTLSVYGSTTIQTWQNVPTAFRILNAATSSVFTIDTVNASGTIQNAFNIGGRLTTTGQAVFDNASSTYFSTSQNLNVGNNLFVTGSASSTYFSTSQNLNIGNSLFVVASSTFQNLINVGTGTSTFNGGIIVDLLNIRNTSATSTFANGITLANGCFAIGATCVGGGGASGWTDDGTIVRLTASTDFVGIGTSTTATANLAIYGSTTLQTWQNVPTAFQILNAATSSVFTVDTVNTRVGIGTSTPFGALSVNHAGGEVGFVVGSSSATSFIVDKNGNVGIGTMSPAAKLHLVDTTAGNNFIQFVEGSSANENRKGGFRNLAVGADDDRIGVAIGGGDGSSFNRIWADNSGILRITSVDPTAHNSGGVVGDQTSALSLKHLVGQFTDYKTALDAIVNAPLYRFTYKNHAYNDEEFVGIIADYSPVFGKDRSAEFPNGVALNEVTAFGYTVAAIKELNSRTTEVYSGNGLAVGDVVKFSETGNEVIQAIGQSNEPVVGVVTSFDTASSSARVSFSGKTPVKVSTESGPIKIGDRITSSSLAGVGMKAVASGMTIGIALENFDATSEGEWVDLETTKNPAFGEVLADSNQDGHSTLGITSIIAEPQSVSSGAVDNSTEEPAEGFAPSEPTIPSVGPNSITGSDVSYQDETTKVKTGKILVFVNLSLWFPEEFLAEIHRETEPPLPTSLFDTLLASLQEWGITIERGIIRATEFIADRIRTKELCIEDVCVTREQLKVLLERNGLLTPPTSVDTPILPSEEQSTDNIENDVSEGSEPPAEISEEPPAEEAAEEEPVADL